jgi:outer membrane protein
MRVYILLLCVVALAVASLGIYVFYEKPTKTAFVYNQQVFEGFKGTIELKARLAEQQNDYKKNLDSIALLIQAGRVDLNTVYQERAQEFTYQQQQVTEKYTADIWKRINEEIGNYGKENRFEFIFGASGNGSLMYANDAKDITSEMVAYLNARYDDKAP